MKILIVELDCRGHHFILYLNKLICMFLKKKYQIFLLTTKSSAKSQAFKILKKKYLDELKVFLIKDIYLDNNKNFVNKFYFQFKYFFLLFNNITKLNFKYKFTKIYFNHFDPFFYAYAILGFFLSASKISGLLLNIKFHQYFFGFKKKTILDNLKLLLFKLFLKNKKVENVFIIDTLFKNFLVKKKIFNKKIIHVNEAVNKIYYINKRFCKKKLSINKVGKCILIYGAISKRKGVMELLKALSVNLDKNIFVIIAGKFDNYFLNEVTLYLRMNNFLKKKVIVINKFISLKEENYLFNICDYVWLGYNNFSSDSSSGVLQLSVVAQKPVIASNRGLISFIVRKNKIGLLFNDKKYSDYNRILKSISISKKYFFKKNLNIYKKKIILNNFEKQISNAMQ